MNGRQSQFGPESWVTMSNYQIAQVGPREFRVVETRPDGFWRIVGCFWTRARAEAWIVNQTSGDGAEAGRSA
jgi:hypothetical protein